MAIKIRSGFDQMSTVKIAHSAITAKDTIYVIGGHPVLAIKSAAANVSNTFLTDGNIEYAAAAADEIAVLDTLYWDDANSVFTKVADSNVKAGYAVKTKAADVTSVELSLVVSLVS